LESVGVLLRDTNYPADILARKGLVEEGVSFLSKPFSSARLASKVRKVLDGKP